MRLVAPLILVATLITAPICSAQTGRPVQIATPVSQATEKCIRDNVPSVERNILDLARGTEFLVGYVCAKESEAERLALLRARNDEMAREAKEDCERDRAQKSPTADSRNPDSPCYSLPQSGWTLMPPLEDLAISTPEARSLAARLLLAARDAHAKR